MSTWQPTMPGLDLGTHTPSRIETAARATLAELDRLHLLRAEHALSAQLILDLAAACDRGLSFGRVSVATSTLVKQLLEAIETLPSPPDASDAMDELEDELERAAGKGADQ